MKQYRLVVPDNDMTREQMLALEGKIAYAYNGFTKFYGYGTWFDEKNSRIDEHVVIYDIMGEKDYHLKSTIARWVKRELNQKAVYVVGNDGPEII